MQKLISKVALVTGGASGLGKAIAQRLHADGASVVITDVQRELGHATAVEGHFTFLEQDVSDEVRWSQVVREVEESCGRLDILVNNAGILGPTDAFDPENSRLADWQRIFAINVEGVFLGCRAAIPAMRRAGGGAIVNLSSITALQACSRGTAYGASKAAVWHLTKSVAQYCLEHRLNIRCNSVHPGSVRTPLVDKYFREAAHKRGVRAEDVAKEVEALTPTQRFTTPDEIAAAVAFLAYEETRNITGTKLVIDGGVLGCNTLDRSLLSAVTKD